MGLGAAIPFIKGLAPKPIDPADVGTAVADYLEDHPEATCPIDDTAGEGDTGKVWSADKSAGEVATLSEAIANVQDGQYEKTEKTASATASGWRLNESDGLCSMDNSYKMLKFTVTAGNVVKIVSDDRFQFQNSASVPASGPSNRVGDTTYGAGTFILTVPNTATYLIVSTPTTGSTAKAYDCEEILGSFEELKTMALADNAKIDDRTLYPTVNQYDPSKQTAQTISPHYYVNGVPYSSTQFDSVWNCTAPIPVKPNTKYALGLVPAVGEIVKPWNTAAYGWFAYDSSDAYISGGADNVFTTPANTAYIRFNYYITLDTVSLAVLNQKCVLVEGESLPLGYLPYGDITIKQKVESVGKKINYVIGDNGDAVTLISKYNASNDIAVTLKKKGGNNLFDFYQIGLVANSTADISTSAESQTLLMQTVTDWFSPFVVKAKGNIDGDDPSSNTFTGGNHQYNNTGEGSTATARTTALMFKADNIAVSSGSGSCSMFEMDWTNLVQGTNTKKSDGTGREILQENHRLIFDGFRFEAFVDLIPLEDVNMQTWYGLQWSWTHSGNGAYKNTRYIGGTNREENDASSANSKSDDAKCCHVVGYSTNHEIRVDIDAEYDLGDHKFYTTGDSAMFTQTYGKGYCNFFSGNDLGEDEMYSLHGWYQFKSRT